jgi:hypothetical protein
MRIEDITNGELRTLVFVNETTKVVMNEKFVSFEVHQGEREVHGEWETILNKSDIVRVQFTILYDSETEETWDNVCEATINGGFEDPISLTWPWISEQELTFTSE